MSLDVLPYSPPDWDRARRQALAAAAAGLGVFLVLGLVLYLAGGIGGAAQLFLSYLVAYNFWVGITLGCLVLLMLQHLTGGAWGLVLRRVLESGARTIGLAALLFLPLVLTPFLGQASPFLWADPEAVKQHHELQHKIGYFHPLFYLLRTAVFFGVWALLAYRLTGWSADQDREGEPSLEHHRRFRVLSGPGLALYGLCVTFASIDWVMSLEPTWFSTIFPVLFAVGQVLTGFAFAVVVLLFLARKPPLAGVIGPAHRRDLGNLLLAFVMLWAYMSISQYLLIWSGNLPEEIPWYLRRTRGGWQGVAVVLAVLHFALPFLLLLSRDVKQNPLTLARVAAGLLVLRFLDVFWWIEPSAPHPGQYLFWLLDLAALVGVGGVWVWWFIGQLQQRPLLPVRDPYLPEALAHEYHA